MQNHFHSNVYFKYNITLNIPNITLYTINELFTRVCLLYKDNIRLHTTETKNVLTQPEIF